MDAFPGIAGGGINMTDTIELKIKEYGRSEFMCATCDNNITELRAMKFPICDDCLKDLREIIKERRLKKENGIK